MTSKEFKKQQGKACDHRSALSGTPGAHTLRCMAEATWRVGARKACDEHLAYVARAEGCGVAVTPVGGSNPPVYTADTVLTAAGVGPALDRLQQWHKTLADRVALLVDQRDQAEAAINWLTPDIAERILVLMRDHGVTFKRALAWHWTAGETRSEPGERIQTSPPTPEEMAPLLSWPPFVPMPDGRALFRDCTALIGPCRCGGWHMEAHAAPPSDVQKAPGQAGSEPDAHA
jgi:hypothetical protein